MRRTKMPYLVALVVTIAALLLSTWGTGVSWAQDEAPEPTTTTTLPDSDDPGEECTRLDRLLDLCLPDGTRCTAARIAVEVMMSGLGGFPAPCMQSPWALFVLIAGGLSPFGAST